MEYVQLYTGLESLSLGQMLAQREMRLLQVAYIPTAVPGTLSPVEESEAEMEERPVPQENLEALMAAWMAYLEAESNQFQKLLLAAIRCRLSSLLEYSPPFVYPRVGLLFSGGVDSLCLAVLANKALSDLTLYAEPIQLLNVAFQQPNGTYHVPDRHLGERAVRRLRLHYPSREWIFTEVNVTKEELATARTQTISSLIAPKTTVLDDSLGCALWFAARGAAAGVRLLLSGAGADEYLGGYARHRTRYEKDSWSGLASELAEEAGRLGPRNLGRDDRVLSDSGREARLPFLDQAVVSFLSALPLSRRCDYRLPRGIGEKLLLRCLLYREGLRELALSPKRALQFGSRIAKLESRKESASQHCLRLSDPLSSEMEY